ncbi:MAG: NUDIX hydrolase [Acidimicrobiales bacterium]|jgi:ADP-ribose pyrophosphatase|nr:NUDIX hydrolase [Acidimicrobiales bacterium]
MAPPADTDAGFRREGERLIHRGAVVTMAVGSFVAPDGHRFERDVVHHPGAVSVVPLLDDDTVVLVRQYRAALDLELLEIPAGKRDLAGEPPELTAHRELQEEIGMRAGRLEKLAEFFNSPGFCDEHSHVYLGRELEPAEASLQGVEEQHLTIERLALDEVPARIADGTIVDAKTIIGLSLAMRRLGR